METGQVRLHAIVEGLVQGVGFRMFVLEQANSLGLTGWVRNLPDSSVEITVEGQRSRIEQLLFRIETGPRGAYINNIKKEWGEAKGEFLTFEIRRTPLF